MSAFLGVLRAPCREAAPSCRWGGVVVLFVGLLGLTTAGTAAEKTATAATAGKTPEIILPRAGTVVLGPDDTLELLLKLSNTAKNPGRETAALLRLGGEKEIGGALPPEVGVWLTGAEEAPRGKPLGHVFLHRAAGVLGGAEGRAWLLHVRGLRPPSGDNGGKPLDLVVRWREVKEAENSGKWDGERRFPGRVRFRETAPDVVLVLDGSASMKLNDPRRVRVAAVRTFLSLGRRLEGVGRAALVEFDDHVRVLLPPTPLTQTAALEKALARVHASGQTDLDGGIRAALRLLQGGRAGAAGTAGTAGALVLLSDGKQEPGPYKNAHRAARAAGVPIHTVALGKRADRELLRRIAVETGGTFSTAASSRELVRLYENIAAVIARARTLKRVALPVEPPAGGGTGGPETATPFRVPVPVDGTCRSLCVEVFSSRPGELLLRAPTEAADRRSGLRSHPLHYLRAPRPGTWSAGWLPAKASSHKKEKKGKARSPELRATVKTELYPLFFAAPSRPDKARPATGTAAEAAAVEKSGALDGKVVVLDGDLPTPAFSLAEGTKPLPAGKATLSFFGREEGRGKCLPSKKPLLTVRLHDDGRHGDGAPGDGVYATVLTREQRTVLRQVGGRGKLAAAVTGRRASGQPFYREVYGRWRLAPPSPPRLLTSGPLDLGTCFSGAESEGKFLLRRTGDGTSAATISVNFATPRTKDVREFSGRKSVAALGAAEKSDPKNAADTGKAVPFIMPLDETRAFALKIVVPPGTPPGLYGGRLLLRSATSATSTTEGQADAADKPLAAVVPWRVRVRTPAVSARPERLDLGKMLPGEVKVAGVVLRLGGGRRLVGEWKWTSPAGASAGTKKSVGKTAGKEGAKRFFLAAAPVVPDSLTATEKTLTLRCGVSPTAATGPTRGELVLYEKDAAGEKLGVLLRLPVEARVLRVRLAGEEVIDLGRLEPGETVTQLLRFRWEVPPVWKKELAGAARAARAARAERRLPAALRQALRDARLTVTSADDAVADIVFRPRKGNAAGAGAQGAEKITGNETEETGKADELTAELRVTARAAPEPAKTETDKLPAVLRQRGVLSVRAGPAAWRGRLRVRVVPPATAARPARLDFGAVRAGETYTRRLVVPAQGTRKLTVRLTAAIPLAKPRLPHIKLPLNALRLAPEKKKGQGLGPPKSAVTLNLLTGTAAGGGHIRDSAAVTVALHVPETAQDGLYTSELVLRGTEKSAAGNGFRGGERRVGVRVRVLPEVAGAPPFHLSPARMTLRFEAGKPLPTGELWLTSHRDEDLLLKLEARAPPALKGSPVAFLRGGKGDVRRFTLRLPAREQVKVVVHGREEAGDGERALLHVDGGGERQTAEVFIERPRMVQVSGLGGFREDTVYFWFTLLFLLLLALLVLLLRALVKKKWLRLTVYAVALHAAFMPLMMPREDFVGVVSSSPPQLTLRQLEEEFDAAASTAQLRRLAAAEPREQAEPRAPLPVPEALKKPGVEQLKPPAPEKKAEVAPGRSAVEPKHRAAPLRKGPAVTSPEAARAAPEMPEDTALADDEYLPDEQPPGPQKQEAAPPAPTLVAAVPTPRKPLLRRPPVPAPAPARLEATPAPSETVSVKTVPLSERPVPRELPPLGMEISADSRRPVADLNSLDEPLPTAAVPALPEIPAAPKKTAAAPPALEQAAAPVQVAAKTFAPPVPKTPMTALRPAATTVNAVVRAVLPPVTEPAAESVPLSPPSRSTREAPAEVARPLIAAALPAEKFTAARPAAKTAVKLAPPPAAAAVVSRLAPSVSAAAAAAAVPAGRISKTARPGGTVKPSTSPTGGTTGGTSRAWAAFLQKGTGKLAVAGFRHGGGTPASRRPGGGGLRGDAPLPAGKPSGARGGKGGAAAVAIAGRGFGKTKGAAVTPDLAGNGRFLASAGRTGVVGGPAPGNAARLLGCGRTPPGNAVGPGTGAGARRGERGEHGTESAHRWRSLLGKAAGADEGAGPSLTEGGRPTGKVDGVGAVPAAPLRAGAEGAGGEPSAGRGKLTGADGADNSERKGAAPPPAPAGGVLLSGRFGPPKLGGGGLPGVDSFASAKRGFFRIEPERRRRNSTPRFARRKAPFLPWSVPLSAHREPSFFSRPPAAAETSAQLRFHLGRARHSGDWRSSKNALKRLAVVYAETTQLPDVKYTVRTVSLADPRALKSCDMVMLTSNEPVHFNEKELAAVRRYVEGGGLLWVNDSSAKTDERFDHAFREDIKKMWPDGKYRLRRLPDNHQVFTGSGGRGYDFYRGQNGKRGYRGWFPPPGDKYRQTYLEGIEVPASGGKRRPALLYTRNDYADGMAMDPEDFAGGKPSETNLTRREMNESSLLMGINIIACALGDRAPLLPRVSLSQAEYERLYRWRGGALPVFDDFTGTVVSDATAEGEQPAPPKKATPAWKVEDDEGNPASVEIVPRGVRKGLLVRLAGGPKEKTFVGRLFKEGAPDLSSAEGVVLDLYSEFSRGIQVSLLFQTRPNWTGYETRPLHLRPGWNRNLFFALNRGDFKSDLTGWKAHDTDFRPRRDLGALHILIYQGRATGNILLSNLRIARQKNPPPSASAAKTQKSK